MDEQTVLIKAMRDSNIPKFLKDDLPLFSALIQDLFPGAEIPAIQYGQFEDVIKTCVKEDGLQIVPSFVTKVQQLFETFNVRFGVMLVGPTGSGKTRCYQILAEAMSAMKKIQLKFDARY